MMTMAMLLWSCCWCEVDVGKEDEAEKKESGGLCKPRKALVLKLCLKRL